ETARRTNQARSLLTWPWLRAIDFRRPSHMERSHSLRPIWYSVAGIVLSIAAPTGLLVLRELYAPRPFIAELASERITYIYVLVTTAAVLAAVGFALGRQAERLAALWA